MREVRYDVYQTNSDLEELKIMHQGFDRDIAESVMVKLFTAAHYETDYMLLSHSGQEFVGACFTAATISKRNECQS